MTNPLSRVNPPGALYFAETDEAQRAPTKELATKEPLKNVACFTAGAARVTFSPEFSAFIQGMKMWINPDKGGYFGSSFDQGFGFLLVAASPVCGLLRLLVGAPVTAVGAVATAALGVAFVAEKGTKATVNAAGHAFEPSAASQKKRKLAEKFVARMDDILKDLPYNQQLYFREHVRELVAISAATTAFLSRNAPENSLKVGQRIVRRNELQGFDDKRIGYFTDICEMKAAIQSLQLSFDSSHAWETLKTMVLAAFCPEKEYAQQLTSYSLDQQETVTLLIQRAFTLADKVTEDPIFKEEWRKSL